MEEEQFEEDDKQSNLDKLLASPDIQKAISQIPELIKTGIETKNEYLKAQIESQTGTTRGATKWMLVWTVILALIIVIPVFVLSWYDKISSDATTFLFGTIVGAAFTFLRNFFPRGG